jgi:hypothetical protein
MDNDNDETMHTYAELAGGSYGGKDMSHLGYEVDSELSNRNRTVYHNKDTGKAVMSFRGTNVKNKADLATDALLALGLKDFSSRFRNANKYSKRAIEKYGKDNVAFTGHSLGGSQALYVNSKHGNETHAYNPFVEPKQPKANLLTKGLFSLFKRPVKSNATIYKTTTDPISLFSSLSNANVKEIKPTSKNGHALKNFYRRK